MAEAPLVCIVEKKWWFAPAFMACYLASRMGISVPMAVVRILSRRGMRYRVEAST